VSADDVGTICCYSSGTKFTLRGRMPGVRFASVTAGLSHEFSKAKILNCFRSFFLSAMFVRPSSCLATTWSSPVTCLVSCECTIQSRFHSWPKPQLTFEPSLLWTLSATAWLRNTLWVGAFCILNWRFQATCKLLAEFLPFVANAQLCNPCSFRILWV